MSGKTTPRRAHRLAAALATALTASMSFNAATARTTDIEATVREVERYCTASWRAAGIPRQEWDDCTQEAIARFLEKLTEPEGDRQKDDAYRDLQRVIWSTAKAWHRSAGKTATTSLLSPPTTDDATEQLALREAVRVALSSLSKLQREVILRWMAGESVAEIATALGCSPERVSDTKYKAIRKLRQALRTLL